MGYRSWCLILMVSKTFISIDSIGSIYIDKRIFSDYLKVECGNTTSGSFNMAALCACYSRLILKNIRTVSVSQLTKNSLKVLKKVINIEYINLNAQ